MYAHTWNYIFMQCYLQLLQINEYEMKGVLYQEEIGNFIVFKDFKKFKKALLNIRKLCETCKDFILLLERKFLNILVKFQENFPKHSVIFSNIQRV